MSAIKALCVFCGSSRGRDRGHADFAHAFGRACAARGMALIFGGGGIGLMAAAADGALAAGGRVTGIIPRFLEEPEVVHRGVTELLVVDGMHARKQEMFRRADGFVALPGGFGTLDETFEIITWRLLGLHDKPIVLADHRGYWRPLLALLDHVVAEGFAGREARELYTVARSIDDIFDRLDHGDAACIAAAADRL